MYLAKLKTWAFPNGRPSTHKRSDSDASRVSSRPTSRTSRKWYESVGTVDDKDEKEKKKMSIARWAFGSRGKKSKEKFATLGDQASDPEDDPVEGKGSPQKKTSSFHSITWKLSRDKSKESSLKLSTRILKPPFLQGKRMVRALHSFSGATDELSFSAGDEIVVVNEVLEDWWMGELRGKKGLFPMTYVEVIAAKRALPSRPPSSRSNDLASSISSEGPTWKTSMDDDSLYLPSDLDDDDRVQGCGKPMWRGSLGLDVWGLPPPIPIPIPILSWGHLYPPMLSLCTRSLSPSSSSPSPAEQTRRLPRMILTNPLPFAIMFKPLSMPCRSPFRLHAHVQACLEGEDADVMGVYPRLTLPPTL